jgi:serine/threonine protein kinase
MTELLGGKYEVLELAGEGGMAKVYRGQTHGAAGFTRPVAIKRVLAPLSQNPEFLKMFVEEARVVSELDHPNIAQIHDFDRDRTGEYLESDGGHRDRGPRGSARRTCASRRRRRAGAYFSP